MCVCVYVCLYANITRIFLFTNYIPCSKGTEDKSPVIAICTAYTIKKRDLFA